MLNEDLLLQLRAEFPELAEEQLAKALQESNNNFELAKSIVQKRHYDDKEDEAFSSEDQWSWSNISNFFSGTGNGLSLRQLEDGLNSLSASMSLGARNVVHTLSTILPPEINPFIEEYDDEDEEEESFGKPQRDVVEEPEEEAVVRKGTSANIKVKRRGGTLQQGGGNSLPLSPHANVSSPTESNLDSDYEEDGKWD